MRTPYRAFLSLASMPLVLVPLSALAQAFSVPNTFVPGTPATAGDVNANFSATAAAINGKQALVTGSCPAGSAIQAINANGTVVCQQLAFFGGDGSAGNLTISASTDWTAAPPVSLNFANVTINPGQTLTVPAGTTIRCSGTFTNNGTLSVAQGAKMGGFDNFALNATEDIYSVGHPGDSFRPAVGGSFDNGAAGTGARQIQGGLGGEGIPRTTAMTSFNAFRFGGGSGGGWRFTGMDGNGGGLVKIYCTGAIVNAGTINAIGGTPSETSGGGGGGIVVMASGSSVTHSGTINVNGGNGGVAFGFGGAGAGGGGGIVVSVAPAVSLTGTINVTGGTGGSVATQITAAGRYGGGGGGASGGNGGNGGDIPASATATSATPTSGSAGYSLSIIANPAFLLH
jgi:hypothetical protein